jgi:hypothetical protein
VAGKARIYGGPPQFWLWTGLLFAAFGVIYWKFAQGELESGKSAVMAKQRAIAQSLGPKLIPFVGRSEQWVSWLAAAGPGDELVSPKASLEGLAKGPGVYLRLRKKNARSQRSIREAAAGSLRDGFTSCLFVREEKASSKSCDSPGDCPPGQLCNDWRLCAPPSQPYNMRLAYRALRVLSPQWTDDLHQASTDLKVRAFELDLDAVTKNDVPIAIEVLSRARYFTAVLDDEPKGGLPPAEDPPPGEAPETEEERLQRAPHEAAVGVWDLKSGEPLIVVFPRADGVFVPVGERVVSSTKTVAAQQRQVNSCAIALAVKEAVYRAAQPAPEPSATPPGKP